MAITKIFVVGIGCAHGVNTGVVVLVFMGFAYLGAANYYSMYGHVEQLAQEITKGANAVEGVEATLYQVPETLSQEVLGKMGAPPKAGHPVIQAAQLPEADGLIFGFPTRYGMMCAQFKAFLDATGGLWRTQALAGKPAGLFVSTGTQGGGQETTAYVITCPNHSLILPPPDQRLLGIFGHSVSKSNRLHVASFFFIDLTNIPRIPRE